MKKQLWLLLLAAFTGRGLSAQTNAKPAPNDTLQPKDLQEVTIRAYEHNKTLLETPAAINVIGTQQLYQFSNTNILQAVNTTPGIRMEERSPGSYRLSIRGSALESPFGVRNVKVYYNDIPYTQAGGNTYLNQLGFYNFQSIEIIKGPGSSLYGAGTGGVVLINSMEREWKPGFEVNYTGGSYNLSSSEAGIRLGDSATRNSIRYQHLSGDGYRQQTALHKDVLTWDAAIRHNKHTELDAHFLYGDLYYQTPGALLLSEYIANPQQARPETATAPGAISSHAAINQKTILAGFTCKEQLSKIWSNSTTLFADYSVQLNPNLRNYSRVYEPDFGGRSVFKLETNGHHAILQWITGAEYTEGLTTNRIYKNVNGQPQNLQTDQDIDTKQLSVFTQLSCTINNWMVTGGLSVNQVQLKSVIFSAAPQADAHKTYAGQAAPRLAILHKATPNIAVYATVENGFSPPSIDELAPTGSAANLNLNPELGWNYEAGTRGYARGHRLFFDISLFYFQLHNTIVQRRDTSGGDSYVNAGFATQAGVEAYSSYRILHNGTGFFRNCNVYVSYTGNDFHYEKFVQLTTDYSGRQIPGSAPNSIAAGADIDIRAGVYLNVNNFYSDRIALNDANSAYAKAYNNLSARIGYRKQWRRYLADIYAGADNLPDQTYSLGNDINAAGGRYYNAAPRTNYFLGATINYGR